MAGRDCLEGKRVGPETKKVLSLRFGTYIWTAASAGWFVIGYVTSLDQAYLASILCGGMAVIYYKTWELG